MQLKNRHAKNIVVLWYMAYLSERKSICIFEENNEIETDTVME